MVQSMGIVISGLAPTFTLSTGRQGGRRHSCSGTAADTAAGTATLRLLAGRNTCVGEGCELVQGGGAGERAGSAGLAARCKLAASSDRGSGVFCWLTVIARGATLTLVAFGIHWPCAVPAGATCSGVARHEQLLQRCVASSPEASLAPGDFETANIDLP